MVTAPPRAFQYRKANPNLVGDLKELAKSAVSPDYSIHEFGVSLQLRETLPGWDTFLAQRLSGEKITNQGKFAREPRRDELGLIYASGPEVQISKAFKDVQRQNLSLLFFPLPVAVVKGNSRVEPDF